MNIKTLLFLLITLSLLLPVVNASSVKRWDTEISLNDDGTADHSIYIEYNETVTKSDYFVFSIASDVRVSVNNQSVRCNVKQELGTLIICDGVNTTSILYEFKAYGLTANIADMQIFRNKYSVTQLTDEFSLKLKLPLGAAVAEKSKLVGDLKPFEPEFGGEGSDGRQIYIKWTLEKPKLGESLDISVMYEKIGPAQETIVVFSIALVVIAALVFVFLFMRRDYRRIMPVLTESERRVMKIVLKEKKVDQRKVVKDTDFSKAKVSRIIKDLEGRGLVERIRKGRTNIIKLSGKKMIRAAKPKGEVSEV